jgi:hypothetical protein
MSVKFANNAFGTLNAGINNSATSVTLSSGQGARFPTLASGEYFYATLIDTSNNLEVVKCTARSTDVLTITRAQESTSAQAFSIGDRVELRVTAQGLDDAANPYDKDSSSTGSFGLPSGTTAQQPTAANTEGHIRYDTDDNIIYYSDGASWLKVSSVVPILSSVTGSIVTTLGTTLTLAGSGFLTANLTVNFTQSADSIDVDVVVTPTSDTAATVAVPAAAYNNVTAGNAVSITVTNSDNVASAATNKTAVAVPSGGTVTTSGNFRIHTFTNSGTFTNTITNLVAQYLVIAGGAGGGGDLAGGGGAGGYRSSVPSESSGGGASAESTLTLSVTGHTITVGAGGAGATAGASRNSAATVGSDGGSSSIGSLITAVGGGGGGVYGATGSTLRPGRPGGSGGGAGSHDGGTTISGGAGTSGQGFAGGSSSFGGGVGYTSGGGGGAGSVGANAASTTLGGAGGSGVSSSITGSSVARAGGGGGSSYSQGSAASAGGAGQAGGGNGGFNASSPNGIGANATANTGSGGGGGSWQGTPTTGGNGGSGLVIIRYDVTAI